MSWALYAIQSLKEGHTTIITPRGSSMEPKISSRNKVTLVPFDPNNFKRGDIVLARVNGRDYLHLIKGVKKDQVLIGNNKGHLNGWTNIKNVFGIVVKIES